MAAIFIIIYKEIDIKSVNRVDNTFIFYCEYGYMKKLFFDNYGDEYR